MQPEGKLLFDRVPSAVRVRPGDRPVWVDADDDGEHHAAWRRAAAAHGVPVDALIAVLLEWHATLAVPGIDADLLTTLVAAEPPRLAPTEELRAWDRLLAGRGPAPQPDELPELCLPARIMMAYGHSLRVSAHVDVAAAVPALAADRAAARHGLTLESWALRGALLGA